MTAPQSWYDFLGCNQNRVGSETAPRLLADHGYTFTGNPADADIRMVNTCGFIESAKEESIDTIFEMAQYKQLPKTGRRIVHTSAALVASLTPSLPSA